MVYGLVRKHCAGLGVAKNSELPKALFRCLESDNSKAKLLATQIAAELGRRLAPVLYTTKQVTGVPVAERAGFEEMFSCQQFLLGGGRLVSGLVMTLWVPRLGRQWMAAILWMGCKRIFYPIKR